jgi:hypothetical protein
MGKCGFASTYIAFDGDKMILHVCAMQQSKLLAGVIGSKLFHIQYISALFKQIQNCFT